MRARLSPQGGHRRRGKVVDAVRLTAEAAMVPFAALLSALSGIPDPRRSQGRRYPLAHLLLFSVLAVLAGATSYRGILSFIGVHPGRLNATFRTRLRRGPPPDTPPQPFLAPPSPRPQTPLPPRGPGPGAPRRAPRPRRRGPGGGGRGRGRQGGGPGRRARARLPPRPGPGAAAPRRAGCGRGGGGALARRGGGTGRSQISTRRRPS